MDARCHVPANLSCHSAHAHLRTRYLPSASVAFVDEIFKANSAILNSLLTIINERLFDNGSVREKVPLRCLVGRRV